ncbi:Na+/H+ antiporter subunit G [Rhodobacteraceae bacterium CCMM004]|nr:Na+/H+ antiporter subunit G [Rhodobacteraceae bacterium CCMM004]
MTEVISGVLILIGCGMAVIAALGLIRLPDVLIRMHASTKVGTLSCGLTMAAVAVHFIELAVAVRCIAIIVFLLMTAPIAGHMIGRAALRTGVPMWRGTPRKDG